MIDKITLYGLLAGMVFIWIWNWALMRILLRHERWIQDRRRYHNEEQRCGFCATKKECPEAYSGVIYPCPYFKSIISKEELEKYYGQKH